MEKIEYRKFSIEFVKSDLAVYIRKDGFVMNKFMSLGGHGWRKTAKRIVDNWYNIQ